MADVDYWINGSSRNDFLCAGTGGRVCVCTDAAAPGCGVADVLPGVLPWAAGGRGMAALGGGSSGPLRPHPASGSETTSARASATAS